MINWTIEGLRIVAESYPIAIMVVGIAASIVVRRSLKQSMEIRDSQYRASNAVVIRERTD